MASPVLYRARYLLPISAPPIEDGALLVADGRIVETGPFSRLSSAHSTATLVDFEEGILLPPFANTHTHLELTAFPDWAAAAGEKDPPQDFVDWILWLVRVKRTVSDAQLAASLQNGLRASLNAGSGVIGDICTTLDAASAYNSSPHYGRIFAEVLGQDLTVVRKRLSDIQDGMSKRRSMQADWGLSPHAPYTLSSQALDEAFAFAAENRLQSCIHLAESQDECSFLEQGSGPIAERLYAAAQWPVDPTVAPGCSPVKTLCRDGRLKNGDLVVHGVEVSEKDISLLKQFGCSVVLCPRSNAALHGGKAPVARYLEAGVNLAIGTDSLASAPSLSIWDELAFARHWFDGAATPAQWLEIATSGGARALGLESRTGALAIGRDASFQVVTLPGLPAVEALEEALCSAGEQAKVTQLVLRGQNVLS